MLCPFSFLVFPSINSFVGLQKPAGLLAFGVVAMALSCLVLLSLIICMGKEVYAGEKQQLCNSGSSMHQWCLDETFILGVVLILVMSMGSSSMVEEEQYIWHFFISTSYMLLLRKTVQYLPVVSVQSSLKLLKGQEERSDFQVCSIFLLLIFGRILRGWHQGGVNWTYLPDISKWLEQAGTDNLRLIQLVSGLLVISLGLFTLSLFGSRKKFVQVVGFCFLTSGLLVLWYIMEYQDNTFAYSSYGATILAQIIYAILGVATIGTIVVLPWFIPIWISGTCSRHSIKLSTFVTIDIQYRSPLLEFRDSSYVIGVAYMLFWCLLQLLLQQAINSIVIFLLLIQILASMFYYSFNGRQHKEWVEVRSYILL